MTKPTHPPARPISRVLVANRGEIASRIFRTVRATGRAAVAVYSDADRELPFVGEADVAVRLGPASATESYLSIPAVLAAAAKAGADAIHPGYGFLSENAAFAQAVQDAGLTWIGPRPESIIAIGDKRRAKALLQARAPEVPLVPGYHGEAQDDARLVAEAHKVGFPLLLKAAAGGGGKGMRVVRDPATLAADLAEARGEGLRSFASAELLLERYFDHIKHVEVQILGDAHGKVVSLGTRECSMQRRHQKVVEEAPAPHELTNGNGDCAIDMEACAVRIGELIGYTGVGTVEFLVDLATRRFYFLEVNTRLQVEHPVTEETTGLDLVALQLAVAEGRPLADLLPRAFLNRSFTPTLHSVEVRVYAEDPSADFAPSTGRILLWRAPSAARDIRVEPTVRTGSTVTVWYDAMVCKLIATAPTRAAAIAKLAAAVRDLTCLGVRTNRGFLLRLLADPAFAQHTHSTGTIAQILAAGPAAERGGGDDAALCVATAWYARALADPRRRPWGHVPAGWRNMPGPAPSVQWDVSGGAAVRVTYAPANAGHDRVADESGEIPALTVTTPAGREVLVEVLSWTEEAAGIVTAVVAMDGVAATYTLAVEEPAGPRLPRAGLDGVKVHVHARHLPEAVVLAKAPKLKVRAASDENNDTTAKAVMPCRVLKVAVQHGQAVARGDTLLVVESMKMETRIVAKVAGTVEVRVREGAVVEAGAVMARIVPAKQDAAA
ncbi:hypothetical protein H9P43_000801 [Blastocladiella emersonii ATCC 22665]|nr:hypothetical protein H9P43_000801 [Blastocladiella emersonii ATCC 22665]